MTSKACSLDAVLIDDNGNIKEVYNQKDEIEEKYKNIEKIDLKGCFVFPDFIDTHTHSFTGGLYSFAANLAYASSLKDVFELLKNAEPVCGRIMSWQFDENKIKEKRFPTTEELDKLFPQTPVYVRRVDGHSCVINTYALNNIPGLQKKSSETVGRIFGENNLKVSKWFHNVDDETVIRAYKAASEIALRAGITTIHAMISGIQVDTFYKKFNCSYIANLPVEFIPYPQIFNVKKALDLGSPRIGGCILVDGSFGSKTAALLKPYKSSAYKPYLNGNNYCGRLYHADKFWNDFVEEAHNNNLQVAVHAIGDAAITQILNAYGKAQGLCQKDLRHQIIHCELVSDDMLDRMKDLGISIAAQPMFDKLWGGKNGYYARVIGKKRALNCNRLKSIKDRNILLTGGSDWYITELNVLGGIDAAVNMHNKNESLTAYEAVEMYTSNAAKLSFDETRLGKIKTGLQADMVCLDNNPLSCKEINSIKVKKVIKKGKIVYED